jgi:hypothetical protein
MKENAILRNRILQHFIWLLENYFSFGILIYFLPKIRLLSFDE